MQWIILTKIYKAKALSMPTISIKPTRFDITFNKVSFTYEDMKQKQLINYHLHVILIVSLQL